MQKMQHTEFFTALSEGKDNTYLFDILKKYENTDGLLSYVLINASKNVQLIDFVYGITKNFTGAYEACLLYRKKDEALLNDLYRKNRKLRLRTDNTNIIIHYIKNKINDSKIIQLLYDSEILGGDILQYIVDYKRSRDVLECFIKLFFEFEPHHFDYDIPYDLKYIMYNKVKDNLKPGIYKDCLFMSLDMDSGNEKAHNELLKHTNDFKRCLTTALRIKKSEEYVKKLIDLTAQHEDVISIAIKNGYSSEIIELLAVNHIYKPSTLDCLIKHDITMAKNFISKNIDSIIENDTYEYLNIIINNNITNLQTQTYIALIENSRDRKDNIINAITQLFPEYLVKEMCVYITSSFDVVKSAIPSYSKEYVMSLITNLDARDRERIYEYVNDKEIRTCLILETAPLQTLKNMVDNEFPEYYILEYLDCLGNKVISDKTLADVFYSTIDVYSTEVSIAIVKLCSSSSVLLNNRTRLPLKYIEIIFKHGRSVVDFLKDLIYDQCEFNEIHNFVTRERAYLIDSSALKAIFGSRIDSKTARHIFGYIRDTKTLYTSLLLLNPGVYNVDAVIEAIDFINDNFDLRKLLVFFLKHKSRYIHEKIVRKLDHTDNIILNAMDAYVGTDIMMEIIEKTTNFDRTLKKAFSKNYKEIVLYNIWILDTRKHGVTLNDVIANIPKREAIIEILGIVSVYEYDPKYSENIPADIIEIIDILNKRVNDFVKHILLYNKSNDKFDTINFNDINNTLEIVLKYINDKDECCRIVSKILEDVHNIDAYLYERILDKCGLKPVMHFVCSNLLYSIIADRKLNTNFTSYMVGSKQDAVIYNEKTRKGYMLYAVTRENINMEFVERTLNSGCVSIYELYNCMLYTESKAVVKMIISKSKNANEYLDVIYKRYKDDAGFIKELKSLNKQLSIVNNSQCHICLCDFDDYTNLKHLKCGCAIHRECNIGKFKCLNH